MDPHVARAGQLDAGTLYALLRLRVAVFVVEQECAYQELDGRDLEPGTVHLWFTPDGRPDQPSAYLRILAEPDGSARIGRVCVAPGFRSSGQARALMAAALRLGGDRPCVLEAQSYLVDFYAGYGFRPTGPEYVEDGIAHVPMARPPG